MREWTDVIVLQVPQLTLYGTSTVSEDDSTRGVWLLVEFVTPVLSCMCVCPEEGLGQGMGATTILVKQRLLSPSSFVLLWSKLRMPSIGFNFLFVATHIIIIQLYSSHASYPRPPRLRSKEQETCPSLWSCC